MLEYTKRIHFHILSYRLFGSIFYLFIDELGLFSVS